MNAEAVRLRFPARSEYLLLARLAVAGVAPRMGLGATEVADLKLAITEACSNAMRHGYAHRPPGEIELELVVAHDRLELVVEDHGAGIALPVPDVAPSERGGMGLPIIRAAVDELEIRPTDEGTGTVVRMTKLAQGAPEDPSEPTAISDV
jgi:serine/threonine-protein kinase RsbW